MSAKKQSKKTEIYVETKKLKKNNKVEYESNKDTAKKNKKTKLSKKFSSSESEDELSDNDIEDKRITKKKTLKKNNNTKSSKNKKPLESEDELSEDELSDYDDIDDENGDNEDEQDDQDNEDDDERDYKVKGKKPKKKTEIIYDESYRDEVKEDKKKTKKTKEYFQYQNYLDKNLSKERNLEIIISPGIFKVVLERISQISNEIVIRCIQPSENYKNAQSDTNYYEEMGENADFNLVEKVDGERGGIYVVKINEDANTYIKFHMFANRCQFFKCDEGVVSLAIELNNFLQLLRSFEDNIPIYLYQNRGDNSCFYVEQLDSSTKNNKTIRNKKSRVCTCQNTESPPEIGKEKFDNIIAVGSTEFASICKNLSSTSDNIEIRSVKNQITFKCVNDSGSIEQTFCDTSNEIIDSPIVQGTFSLKVVYNFSKCNKICDKVLIFLKNKYPLTMYFDLHKEGKMWVLVAPIQTDDEELDT